MPDLVLIDTSVYIHWFRTRRDVVARLRPLLEADSAVTCGIVVAEVLRGLVHPLVRERQSRLFASMRWLPLDDALWTEVADLGFTLRNRGLSPSLPDLALAVAAQRSGACIQTLDTDFARIPGLRIAPPEVD
jgi:predicted nucleic acid-binding protein